MYGTTIRNYNSSKSTRAEDKRNKSFMGKNKANRRSKKDEFQRTRYMKIEDQAVRKENDNTRTFTSLDKISRREFPIASVILTVVATMILLLIGTGVMG